MSRRFLYVLTALLLVTSLLTACAAPLNTREKGGLLGAGVGAGAGAIIGSTVGRAAVGAAIWRARGTDRGRALIGDQLMAQEQRQNDQ
jgi:hypothetical protein